MIEKNGLPNSIVESQGQRAKPSSQVHSEGVDTVRSASNLMIKAGGDQADREGVATTHEKGEHDTGN